MGPRRSVSSSYDPAAVVAVIVLATLVASLLVGLLVPIYTDEITWRMMLSRSPLDGGVDLGLGKQCAASTMAAPLFMQPMRHLSAWIAVAAPDPRAVRIVGVGLALLWVALLWRLALFLPDALRATGRVISLSLVGLGVLPFLLVWSRPEQALLIAFTLTLLSALATRGDSARTAPMRAWAGAIVIVVLGLIALGYHPKAVVYLPIALVAAAISSRGRSTRPARIAAIVVLVGFGLVAHKYWTARFACPDDPIVVGLFARENAISWIDARAPLASAELLRSALPWRYVKLAAPSSDLSYMSEWLPAVPIQPAIGFAWRVVVRFAWYAAICVTAGLLLVGVIVGLVRWKFEARLAVALTIAATVFLWSATQLNKNAYESALQLPLAAIALILALPVVPRRLWPTITACALPLATFAILSQLLLIGIYGTALATVAARPGPIDRQPYSFVPWGYPDLRREILAAAKACALDPVHSRNLLVDDMSYFPLMQSYQPLHRMAHFGPWRGSIGEPIAFLRSHGSSGAVVACDYLPPEIRRTAKVQGRFCCLGPWAGAGR